MDNNIIDIYDLHHFESDYDVNFNCICINFINKIMIYEINGEVCEMITTFVDDKIEIVISDIIKKFYSLDDHIYLCMKFDVHNIKFKHSPYLSYVFSADESKRVMSAKNNINCFVVCDVFSKDTIIKLNLYLPENDGNMKIYFNRNIFIQNDTTYNIHNHIFVENMCVGDNFILLSNVLCFTIKKTDLIIDKYLYENNKKNLVKTMQLPYVSDNDNEYGTLYLECHYNILDGDHFYYNIEKIVRYINGTKNEINMIQTKKCKCYTFKNFCTKKTNTYLMRRIMRCHCFLYEIPYFYICVNKTDFIENLYINDTCNINNIIINMYSLHRFWTRKLKN